MYWFEKWPLTAYFQDFLSMVRLPSSKKNNNNNKTKFKKTDKTFLS